MIDAVISIIFYDISNKKLRELGDPIFTEYYLIVCKDQRLTLLLKFSKSSAVLLITLNEDNISCITDD
ncbi:hypothetical protein SAMN02745176_03226 [Lutispora thermophila DSM 19022]|uniref:Uncharacterized protein n=1 Tax=Lutispora thermophila DSM 19022 TaxID=1122184 RepID=A0A1M6IFH5_9FIRM|nr:hypothetical protein SAMN02745176_03226 [Lutispora thermophila DSM 19022]